jgi:hypothetical protein
MTRRRARNSEQRIPSDRADGITRQARSPNMGAGESRSSNASGPRARTLHVLRVTPGSPASETDIEPFFDFIVGVDGDSELSEKVGRGLRRCFGIKTERISTLKNIDVHNLERIVEDHEGKALSLVVWSSKAQTTRRTWHTHLRAFITDQTLQ